MTNATKWRDLHPKVKRGFIAATSNMRVVDGTAYSSQGNDISHMVDIVPKFTPEQVRGLEAIDVLSKHEIDNGGFVFTFYNQMQTVDGRFTSLTQPDLARLMFVGSYTSWRDGQLIYDNGRPITKDGLHELTQMSRKRFNEFYVRLVDEDILSEVDGDLFMNPSVFYRGALSDYQYETDDLQHTRMFRKTVRDLYEKYNGRSLGQLAIVYAVLPFIHFKTNVVSYNADESNVDKVVPMPLEKLAIALGYANAQKLKTALNRVKIDGHPVFGFFENPNDRRSIRIVVNPRVFFAAGAGELSALYVLFNM